MNIRRGTSATAEIKKNGYIMDHDIGCWAFFMGEPMLLNDEWVVYNDGVSWLINTVSIRSYKGPNKSVADSIVSYALQNGINYIEFFGDFQVEILPRGGLKTSNFESNKDNVGIQLSLDGFDFSKQVHPKRRQNVRKLKREGFEARIEPIDCLQSDHISLILDWSAQHMKEAYDISYTWAINHLIACPYGVFIEVRKESQLVAFGTLSCFLNDVVVFVHTFVDRSISGASDLLYEKAIDYAKGSGANYLDMGYSVSERLLSYKRSFGANDVRTTVKSNSIYETCRENDSFINWPTAFAYINGGEKC